MESKSESCDNRDEYLLPEPVGVLYVERELVECLPGGLASSHLLGQTEASDCYQYIQYPSLYIMHDITRLIQDVPITMVPMGQVLLGKHRTPPMPVSSDRGIHSGLQTYNPLSHQLALLTASFSWPDFSI